MRGTFAIFVGTLVLIVTGLALYSALGIIRNSDDPAAGAAVTRFGEALKQHDGKGACALLTPSAQSKIEGERKKPCEQGVLELASDLAPKAEVSAVNVAESSAFVTTPKGDAFFLDEAKGGWFVSAAGCKKQAGDAPYDCALES